MSNKISMNLREALFKTGNILPETKEEIKEFEKIINKKDIPGLPEIFNKPSDLIKKGKPTITRRNLKANKIQENKISDSMARAARDGKGQISPEILKKMQKDRDEAENK